MDFIITDKHGQEKGYIDHCGVSLNVGQDNDFEVKIRSRLYDEKKHKRNCRFFAPDTEYGGLIRQIHPVTADKMVKLGGRTWRGILDRIAINPGENDYIYLNGEANYVIGQLLSSLKITELFTVAPVNSGIVFQNYKIPLQSMFMPAVSAALEDLGARIEIKYKHGGSNSRGYVQLAAVPIVDHSETIEISEDGSVKLDILDYQDGVNHLICYGKGELTERQRADLYVWPDGSVRAEQYYTGIDLIEAYHEDTNAENVEELWESGMKKLESLKNYKQLKISVSDMDLELGDIVGGRERVTGIAMKAPVIRKIISVTSKGRMTIAYKLKGEE